MTPAIISKVFPHTTRGEVFGFISLATTVGLSLGYGVGGIVTEYMGWHWIFFVTVPLGALATILTYLYFPKIKPVSEYQGFDLVGSLLIFLAVILLIMPIEMGSKVGWTSPLIIGSLISSGVIFLIFYRWENSYQNPLFHICLLKQKQLNISIIAGFMTSFVLTGTIFLLPFYFELILNYDTDVAGIIILLSTLLIIVVGPLSGKMADRIGSRLPAILGAIILATTMIILTITDPTVGELGVILVVIAIIMRSLADGIFSPANNKLVMSHSPPKMVGSVSSLLNTAKYLGLVLGVVIFETIFDSTISHSSGHMEGVTGTGAFQYSVPVETLLTGFHHAFLIGAVICILIVAASFLGQENLNVTDEIDGINIEEEIIETEI